jgi:DNA ligase-1
MLFCGKATAKAAITGHYFGVPVNAVLPRIGFAAKLLLMQFLAATCEAVAATPKKTEKVRLVAAYFGSRSVLEAAQAAIFLSGRAFPAWEQRTLQIGGTLLWRAVAEVSGKGEVALTASYRRHGDLGSAAHEVLLNAVLAKDVVTEAVRASAGEGLSVLELAATFDELARKSTTAHKVAVLEELLRRATPLEAKYLIKITCASACAKAWWKRPSLRASMKLRRRFRGLT